MGKVKGEGEGEGGEGEGRGGEKEVCVTLFGEWKEGGMGWDGMGCRMLSMNGWMGLMDDR